jgi:hypothetical protein
MSVSPVRRTAIPDLQGSNWSRSRFDFVTHDKIPSAVTATAQPQDVWALSSCFQHTDLANAATASSSLNTDSNAALQQQQQQVGAPVAGSACQTPGLCLGPGLSFAGSYVLHCDGSDKLTVVQGPDQGLQLQLAAAQSEVVTVAPLLEVTAAGSSGGSSGSSSGGSNGGSSGGSSGGTRVQCAVVGLVNMLNPGGAVKSISVSQQQHQQQQLDRSSDDSNNGSSANCDSGSWVLAGATSSAAEATPPQGASEASEPAAVATKLHDTAKGSSGAAAGADGVQLTAQLVGCGQLVLYSSERPSQVVLDGQVVGFSYDAGSNRLGVVVPIRSDACLDHTLTITWS